MHGVFLVGSYSKTPSLERLLFLSLRPLLFHPGKVAISEDPLEVQCCNVSQRREPVLLVCPLFKPKSEVFENVLFPWKAVA